MVLKNKIIAVGLAATLFSLSGCGDRGQEKVEGHILYSDGVLFGVTTDSNLNPADMYNVTTKEGDPVGNLTPDHVVYDKGNNQVGDLPCAGTTDDAYDENGFLVGTCNLGISYADSIRGLSAYEIAVKEGFAGTEAEWLESLKGANGKDGTDGKGALTITTDLPVSAEYPNGAVEIKSGPDTNNNGKLDPEEVISTSVVENGANGKDGAKGDKGDKGDQGNAGAKGDTGELPTQPEYLCEAGDSDPKCGTNQEDYKVSKFVFSETHAVTAPYQDGGLFTNGIIDGNIETIDWEVRRANNQLLPAYTIKNKWDNGAFTSNSADYANHDDASEEKYRLISRDNKLVLESESGKSATVTIEESALVTVSTNGLTITHDKLNRKICFTADVEACISYLIFWEPK